MSFWANFFEAVKCVVPKLKGLLPQNSERRSQEDLKQREIFRAMVKNHDQSLVAHNQTLVFLKEIIVFLKGRVEHLEQVLGEEDCKCQKKISELEAEVERLMGVCGNLERENRELKSKYESK